MTGEPPDDVAALKALLAEARAALAASEAALAERTAALARVEEARRRLKLIVDELRRARFGARSEKRDPERYALPLEDIELAQGMLDAAQERADATLEGSRPERRPVKRNRGRLPAHLPRIERVIEPGSVARAPAAAGRWRGLGRTVSHRVAMRSRPMANDRLDIVPAQFRVLVTRRPRYACRRCSGAVVPGGLPTGALIAHVVASKFGDSLPFYRQAQIYARQDVDLDRATLGAWAGRARFHLQPVVERLRERLGRAERLFVDETTAPLLDPGRGRTRTGFLWAIASDNAAMAASTRPSCSSATPRAAGASGPSGSSRASPGASCNATATRATSAWPGSDARRARGRWCAAEPPAAARQAGRARDSLARGRGGAHADQRAPRRREGRARPAPGGPPGRAAGPLGARRRRPAALARGAALIPLLQIEARRAHPAHALSRWKGLTRFLSDGRLELDTNPVENPIRPIALTRKNALFAGHEVGAENWALLASPLATCKLSAVDPAAYVAATLEAIINGHPQSRIVELMPWRFAQTAASSSRAA